jgi:hypothetical protein
VRIRNFGFLANRRRAELLPLCFRLLPHSAQKTESAAPSVVEPCMSSSDSPAHNSSYDLRLIPVGAQHEVTSPASNHLRVPARTAPLCLVSFRTRSVPSVQALRCTTSPLLCPGISADTTTHQSQGCSRNGSEPAQAHTNPIVPEGGFLQVAVSEAPVDSATEASSSLVGASDTALRLMTISARIATKRLQRL